MIGGAGVFEGDCWRAPCPAYARARDETPVCVVAMPQGGTTWAIARYDDVRAAFTDPRLVKDHRAVLTPGQRAGASVPNAGAAPMMLTVDPPDHTRLRRLVSGAFTARRVSGLRPRIEELAASLLDVLPTTEPVDLLAGYAVPLPMAVMCELLGVPLDDREDFRAWSGTMFDEHAEEDRAMAAANLGGHLHALVEAKRRDPDGALLSALVEVSEAGDRLSADEVAAMGVLMLLAGHETTANLIGNAVLGIVGDAGMRQRLAADRDPQRFDRPELFDPDRETAGHLAFGHGVHHCPGAPLARLEGDIALTTLLARYPGLRLAVPADQLEHRHSICIHGLHELPVILRPQG